MSNKAKGSNAERELYHLLDENGFTCIRAAGSGMMENTSCDLLVARKEERYAIECKVTNKDRKYLNTEQIKELVKFSKLFGVNPIIAIKFNRNGWHFVNPSRLVKTQKGFVMSLEGIKKSGQPLKNFVE